MGNFGERVDKLIYEVGDGPLQGRVVVDQIYAQNQHETLAFKHIEGGKARYLADPFFEHANGYVRDLSRHVLDGRLRLAMAEAMENLSRKVFDQAPFEFGDLKASGHPIVTSNGFTIYDRPPYVHRLNAGDLKGKQELRNLGFGHNSWENTEPDEVF